MLWFWNYVVILLQMTDFGWKVIQDKPNFSVMGTVDPV